MKVRDMKDKSLWGAKILVDGEWLKIISAFNIMGEDRTMILCEGNFKPKFSMPISEFLDLEVKEN